jgi:hypothetical protein
MAQATGVTATHESDTWKEREWRLSNQERLDAAYALVSLRQSSAELLFPRPATHALKDRSNSQATQKARTELVAVAQTGDFGSVKTKGAAYLAALGWHRASKECLFTAGRGEFGSPAFPLVLMLARAAEVMEDYPLAEELYRLTNPLSCMSTRGGICGTGIPHGVDQIRGLIRTTELQNHCQASIAERLSLGHEPHVGVDRLIRTGFDVSRIYRGVLPTMGEDCCQAPGIDWQPWDRAIDSGEYAIRPLEADYKTFAELVSLLDNARLRFHVIYHLESLLGVGIPGWSSLPEWRRHVYSPSTDELLHLRARLKAATSDTWSGKASKSLLDMLPAQ